MDIRLVETCSSFHFKKDRVKMHRSIWLINVMHCLRLRLWLLVNRIRNWGVFRSTCLVLCSQIKWLSLIISRNQRRKSRWWQLINLLESFSWRATQNFKMVSIMLSTVSVKLKKYLLRTRPGCSISLLSWVVRYPQRLTPSPMFLRLIGNAC